MSDERGRWLGNLKLFVAGALVALLMLFALQNMAMVDLTFLFWTFQTRRFVVLLFAFLVGFAIGWLVRSHRR